jgi:TRAP-type C4-dicarboxylate transport system substrate-binding protein
MRHSFLTAFLAATFLMVAAMPGWAGKTVIKMATLAPEGSSWMNVFNELNQELQQKTDNQVKIRIYPGGVLGDERDMLRKMQIGQIHAAALTSAGLSAIFSEFDVFQIPFMFQKYAEVDYIVEQMEGVFRKGLADKGYVLIGWMEGGFVQLMSTVPADSIEKMKTAKVWTWQDSQMSKAIFDEAGVAAIPLSVPDVLVGLQTGLVEVVYAPPSGAISLQWFTKIKYIIDVPLMYLLGGLVVKKSVYDKMTPEHQAVLGEVTPRYMLKLKALVRRDNQQALDEMVKLGIEPLKPSQESILEFKQVSNSAMDRIQGDTFSPDTRDRVTRLLEKFKQENP